jgi:hypothetical protein
MGTYGYRGEPETCIWCGKRLPKDIKTTYAVSTEYVPPKICPDCDLRAPKKTWEPIEAHFFPAADNGYRFEQNEKK